jgi:uncharacterized protein (DUF2147 family)
MRKQTTFAACAIAGASAAASAAPSLTGDWARGDGKARVRIEPCDHAICAVNFWIRPGTENEKVGDKLVMTLSPTGTSSFRGEAWDPQRQLTYAIRVNVGERTMTTRGCLFAGLVCVNMGWTRIGGAP